jgi:hypothetical protein
LDGFLGRFRQVQPQILVVLAGMEAVGTPGSLK